MYCILASLVLFWVLIGLLILRVAPEPVDVHKSIPLEWYIDERSHTGDLLFFKSDVDWLYRLVSPTTHVAMMVMHPVTGEPWILEMHDDKTVEGQGAGVHWYPARERLGAYDGELVVVPIRTPLSASRVGDVASELADVPYKPRMRTYMATCKLLFGLGAPKEGAVCSEFVSFILTRLGVLDGWKCLTPHEVLATAACSPAYHQPYALK